jgi:hypothetical protein
MFQPTWHCSFWHHPKQLTELLATEVWQPEAPEHGGDVDDVVVEKGAPALIAAAEEVVGEGDVEPRLYAQRVHVQ